MVFVYPLLGMQKERDLKIHFVGDFVENDPLRYFVGGSLRKNKGEIEIRFHTFQNWLVFLILDVQQYNECDTITW